MRYYTSFMLPAISVLVAFTYSNPAPVQTQQEIRPGESCTLPSAPDACAIFWRTSSRTPVRDPVGTIEIHPVFATATLYSPQCSEYLHTDNALADPQYAYPSQQLAGFTFKLTSQHSDTFGFSLPNWEYNGRAFAGQNQCICRGGPGEGVDTCYCPFQCQEQGSASGRLSG